jgi:threonine synthase
MGRTYPGIQSSHGREREPLSGAAALRCSGCGAEPDGAEPYPFRCPRADDSDGRDHVLARRDGACVGASGTGQAAEALVTDAAATHPFLRHRRRFWFDALARDRGIGASAVIEWIESLDRGVADVEGHGLVATPAGPSARLAERIGIAPDRLWVKDETGQVAGSHKARHLFALALALEALERAGIGSRAESDRRGLAIASCGNAALAAAVIARAARRPLRAFVPEAADAGVLERLRALGTDVVACTRAPGVAGDPCLARFRAAVRGGALPFCCQGSENGLAVEGGATLAWELVESMNARGAALDRLFVQVGGGALASACVQGLHAAVATGALARLPRLHAVQPEGGPLARAYDRVRARILGRAFGDALAPADEATLADRMRSPAALPRVREALECAARHRGQFMWPSVTTTSSIASGILDDETYDWLAVIEGMIASGGWPVTVSEERLAAAHALAREATGIAVSATGSAGLAGLMELRERGVVAAVDTTAVLFTGVER